MKDAPHIGLARKHRPQLFKDVVGQEAVGTTLANAVAGEKPAQAYLFFGPKGVGKTTSARILAKALNCAKGPTPEPCGKCDSCVEISAGSSIDVLELDAASNTQVDKIREMIIETVSLAPSRDRFKVFIVDEVHMLSTSSFNALLKTLEEPPSHVVFILATTELAKIPATIVSRCQRFRFRPIPADVAAEYLSKLAKSEKIKADKDALALIAGAGGGSLRDAVSLLDQAAAYADGAVTRDAVGELLGMLPEEFQQGLVEALLAKDAKALAGWLDRAAAEGFDPTQLLRDLRERVQALYRFRLGIDDSLADAWKKTAGEEPPETFSFLLKRINRTMSDMRGAESPQLAFELGVYGMLESAYDLREWVQRLEALERKLSGGGAPALSERRTDPAPIKKAAPAQAAVSGPAGDVWPAVLRRMDEEKPALSGALQTCRLEPSEQGPWRLVFQDSFKRDLAEPQKGLMEKLLGEAAGRRVSLSFEVDGKSAEEGRAVPGTGAGKPPANPALKKVLGAFQGAKVKQVRKKSE